MTLSVCMSICHGKTSNWFFFFVLAVSSPWLPLQNVVLRFFDLRPLALTPKICTKSPISRLVWQIDRRFCTKQGVIGDGRFNGTMQNVVGPTLIAIATKFELGAEIQSPTGLSSCYCVVCLSCLAEWILCLTDWMCMFVAAVSEMSWRSRQVGRSTPTADVRHCTRIKGTGISILK